MTQSLPIDVTRARVTTPRVEAALDTALTLGELGVQVCAYVGETLVADAWCGHAEPSAETPVDGNTLFPIFSVTKAATAVATHIQVERGLLEYDAPIARYWPGYGARGKGGITVRHVLAHQAGVPQMPPDATPELIADWEWMTTRLAETEPLFPPGVRNTYLSYTFGWLLGEVVTRTDPLRRPFGQFVLEEVCAPLGMDSFWMGLPSRERERVATLVATQSPAMPEEGTPYHSAAPPAVYFTPDVYNLPVMQQACLAGTGAIANARSVARLFAMLANLGRLGDTQLLSEACVLSCLIPRSAEDDVDYVYGRVKAVGIGGLHLDERRLTPAAEGSRILCHPGAGGSLGWADLDTGLSFAICHNCMGRDTDTYAFGELIDVLKDIAAEHA